jgi:hypothetical protein
MHETGRSEEVDTPRGADITPDLSHGASCGDRNRRHPARARRIRRAPATVMPFKPPHKIFTRRPGRDSRPPTGDRPACDGRAAEHPSNRAGSWPYQRRRGFDTPRSQVQMPSAAHGPRGREQYAQGPSLDVAAAARRQDGSHTRQKMDSVWYRTCVRSSCPSTRRRGLTHAGARGDRPAWPRHLPGRDASPAAGARSRYTVPRLSLSPSVCHDTQARRRFRPFPLVLRFLFVRLGYFNMPTSFT